VPEIGAIDWLENQFTPPSQVTGNIQPNGKQRKVSEHASTRLKISNATLLMIADDLIGWVQRRSKLKDEILLLYHQDIPEKLTHTHWYCGDVSSCLWQIRI
jgi:hypothetical protein